MRRRRTRISARVITVPSRRAGGILLAVLLLTGCSAVNIGGDWRTASRASSGQAPDARTTPEAVVQVYAARAFNWRGIFAVHTWIVTKPAASTQYTVHQALGWNRYAGRPVVVSTVDIPDRLWYGAWPEIIAELRGPAAAAAIPAILEAITSYPYPNDYRLWPGPNSNTFTAYVARQVPQLRLELPVTAIGKDYLSRGAVFGRAPSGTGFQISLFGTFGLLAARCEGIEVNVLGLVFGVDPLRPAIKVPGIGRLGVD